MTCTRNNGQKTLATNSEKFLKRLAEGVNINMHFLFFYRRTIRFEIYVVHSPTIALFIDLVKSSKFTLKYTIISLLHVLVFNDHH